MGYHGNPIFEMASTGLFLQSKIFVDDKHLYSAFWVGFFGYRPHVADTVRTFTIHTIRSFSAWGFKVGVPDSVKRCSMILDTFHCFFHI